jgi:hypothetical protein
VVASLRRKHLNKGLKAVRELAKRKSSHREGVAQGRRMANVVRNKETSLAQFVIQRVMGSEDRQECRLTSARLLP